MNKLPALFIEEIASLFDSEAEREAFLFSISNTEAPTSVRLNPAKGSNSTKGSHVFENEQPVQWCQDGRYLSQRPTFTLDPLFWGGAYYPQEASSMVVGEIVRKLSPLKVLDLCAAPGGKTTHIASVIGNNSLLVSNEVISNRSKILVENVQRWGTGNVIVTSTNPKSFSKLTGYFDLILTDVPCSGEGMFRKDPNSILEWSKDSVQACVSRSKVILSDVWNALETGGYIVFSTCTYNQFEDEQMVEYIINELGAEYIPIDHIVPKEAVTTGLGYHFYPHKTKGEGFFVALLRKTSECDCISTNLKPVMSFKKVAKQDASLLAEYAPESEFDFRFIGDKCYGFPESIISEMDYIRSAVSPIYAGVQFGKIFAGKLKPTHSLALYNKLNPLSVTELSFDDAMHYLRRDYQEPDIFKTGLSAVSYQNTILGWANRVQGRVNNLYPSDLRVRLSI